MGTNINMFAPCYLFTIFYSETCILNLILLLQCHGKSFIELSHINMSIRHIGFEIFQVFCQDIVFCIKIQLFFFKNDSTLSIKAY